MSNDILQLAEQGVAQMSKAESELAEQLEALVAESRWTPQYRREQADMLRAQFSATVQALRETHGPEIETAIGAINAEIEGLRRAASIQPTNETEWALAASQREFIKEDCARWAAQNPDEVVRAYQQAISDKNNVGAFLIQRYGVQALEQSAHQQAGRALGLLESAVKQAESARVDAKKLRELTARRSKLSTVQSELNLSRTREDEAALSARYGIH